MKVKHKHADVEIHYSRAGTVSRWLGPAVQGQPEWILYGRRHPIQVIKDFFKAIYGRLAQ